MKKIIMCLMAACLSLTFQPIQLSATTATKSISLVESKSIESEKARALLSRLYEIKAMDKSNLSSSDRKNLRTEVLSIRNELRPIGGGVYLSAGAVILIVILLIILF